MILVLVLASQAAPLLCGTPRYIAPHPRPVVAPLPPGADKLVRDAWASKYPNELLTTNFAIKWGDGAGDIEGAVQDLAADFETTWTTEVTELGHPLPAGAATYRFNVYIGDSGGDTPDSYGATAYTNIDPDGYPYIVIAPSSLGWDEFAETLTAHEFYHAIQFVTGSFTYGPSAAWFWEATAQWMAGQVFPLNDTIAVNLAGYAFRPQHRVDFVGSGDILDAMHPYGVFIFPTYLSEQLGDWEIVKETWIDPPNDSDPLAALGDAIEARGLTLDGVWLDHLARNATWDYARGADYRATLDRHADYYPGEEEITAEGDIDGEWHTVTREVPERFGSNLLVIHGTGSNVRVDVEGDPTGSEGSPALFGARIVHVIDASPTYDALAFDGTIGTATLASVADGDSVLLVVGAWSDERVEGETFGYRWRAAIEVGDTGTGADTGEAPGVGPHSDEAISGCGCSAGPTPARLWVLSLVVIARFRRRHVV
jgi:MYXO-CTERM domain-containing protein